MDGEGQANGQQRLTFRVWLLIPGKVCAIQR